MLALSTIFGTFIGITYVYACMLEIPMQYKQFAMLKGIQL